MNFSNSEIHFHKKLLNILEIHSDVLLSQREQEVLVALSKGLTNKEISEKLCISLATTKTHLLHIYQKLEVNSRVKVLEKAHQLNIL